MAIVTSPLRPTLPRDLRRAGAVLSAAHSYETPPTARTPWDDGATLWGYAAQNWDIVPPTTWDSGDTTWDTGTTAYDALTGTAWDNNATAWLTTTTQWDISTRAARAQRVTALHAPRPEPTGPYLAGAARMARYASQWRELTPTKKKEWKDYARHQNFTAKKPVYAPRTGAPRYASERRWSGYNMYISAAAASDPSPPLQPTDSTRTEPPDMTELLTGSDYEQRMIATLDDTSGALWIAMYQVAASWDSPSLAASPLFARLLAQPSKRPACKMIMSSQPGGSNLAIMNATAKTAMQAAGWQVRNVPQFPILHAKLWLLEPGHVYTGSHNLSNRATTSNIEAGVLTTSSAAVNSVRSMFGSLWDVAF